MRRILCNIAPIAVITFFGLIYCLISLVNHYLFRTSALDLGMFNQALYHCSHFQKNIFTLDINENETSYFASHFSPIIFLYSPFSLILGSYTLLVIQIAVVLAGGIGIYKISRIYFSGKLIPLLIIAHFYGIWGIYSALSFDFHDNVVAAMLVPWFIYFYLKNDVKTSILFFALIILTKENMALWMIFILIGIMMWKWREDKKLSGRAIRFNLILLVIALVYFLLVFELFMPALARDGNASQLMRYSDFGNSTLEIALNIFKQPIKIFRLFYESTIQGELYTGIKLETHLMFIFSGGFALLFFPEFLIMLIPVYLQKFLSDDYFLWGINGHYSIEFVPILSLTLIQFIFKIKKYALQIWILGLIILSTYVSTILTLENRKSLWYNPVNTAFYSKSHYNSMLNDKMIRDEIKKIPKNAVISASTFLTPHLAARKKIYMFPVVKDADFIILLTKNRIPYPLSAEQFHVEVEKYRKSDSFEIVYEKDEILIFKRLSFYKP